jgi:hypothetical protein
MINTTIKHRRQSDPLTMMGMASEDVLRVAYEASDAGKPILKTLAEEHYRRQGKTPPSTAAYSRPAPTPIRAAVRPVAAPAARPAPTPPPAPAPAGTMPTAAAIACAMLDEQERRAAAALIKSRAAFSALTPRQQSDFCRNGGRITV